MACHIDQWHNTARPNPSIHFEHHIAECLLSVSVCPLDSLSLCFFGRQKVSENSSYHGSWIWILSVDLLMGLFQWTRYSVSMYIFWLIYRYKETNSNTEPNYIGLPARFQTEWTVIVMFGLKCVPNSDWPIRSIKLKYFMNNLTTDRMEHKTLAK